MRLTNLGLQELESTLAQQKKEHEAAVTALKSSLAEQTAEIAKSSQNSPILGGCKASGCHNSLTAKFFVLDDSPNPKHQPSEVA